MSLDYWSMKLSGTYVLFNGKVEYLSEVYLDEDLDIDYGDADSTKEYIQCDLSGIGNQYLDEINYYIPDDQYVVEDNGQVVYLCRSLERNYKLSTTSRMFGNSISDMSKALNFTINPEYSSPEEIFLVDGRDRVYSPDIASYSNEGSGNVILFKEIRLGKVRTQNNQIFFQLPDVVPQSFKTLFQEYMDEVYPFHQQELLTPPTKPHEVVTCSFESTMSSNSTTDQIFSASGSSLLPNVEIDFSVEDLAGDLGRDIPRINRRDGHTIYYWHSLRSVDSNHRLLVDLGQVKNENNLKFYPIRNGQFSRGIVIDLTNWTRDSFSTSNETEMFINKMVEICKYCNDYTGVHNEAE